MHKSCFALILPSLYFDLCATGKRPLYTLLILKAAGICSLDKVLIALSRNMNVQEVVKVHGQLRVQGRQEDCLTGGLSQSSTPVQSVQHDQLNASWFLCHMLDLLIPLMRLCCL